MVTGLVEDKGCLGVRDIEGVSVWDWEGDCGRVWVCGVLDSDLIFCFFLFFFLDLESDEGGLLVKVESGKVWVWGELGVLVGKFTGSWVWVVGNGREGIWEQEGEGG
jgi:hypothetical protein